MRTVSHHVTKIALALAVVASSLAVTASPATAAAGSVPSFGRSIEGFAPYQPQRACSRTATKGAVRLSRWLLARYRGSSSSGIMRACSAGGTSEHKDGRAFDWHVDYRSSRGRAQGLAFLKLARATDRYGNRDAVARRMGIMYIIWNDRIYSASRGFAPRAYVHPACRGKALSRCSSTLRHRDHMHISLGWAGARAVTSFWDGTVAGVGAAPHVATVKPRVAPKPKPKPKPKTKPAPKPIWPPVLDQRKYPVASLSVSPRSSAGTRTSFSLKAGTTYRLVATGYYRFGAGSRLADAACSWHRLDDAGWDRQAEETTATSRLKLTVNGATGWSSPRGSCDEQSHAYVWDYRPSTTGPVTFRVDDGNRSDDAGTLVVRVLRAGASTATYRTTLPNLSAEPAVEPMERVGTRLRGAESLTVTPAGARSTTYLAEGRRYLVRVSGTWTAGDGVEVDAECSKTPAGQWLRRRSADPLHPTADFYDLYLNGQDLRWDHGCSPTHEYGYVYEPEADGNARFAVWDTTYGDDTGSMKVDLYSLGHHGW
ncbi:hypothetical protein [Angustibacter sp. Root456]|uniref:hypothetical protein n=1 Tax=Angustibacter sp. Root456 TaxID=1736539 RepID=UPI0006F85841|nr:hypothetical protein [Angustibacter sp. Root456]KQX65603.1 hypothetical protein ASD06_08140 [Angustibacter sp. Root456]